MVQVVSCELYPSVRAFEGTTDGEFLKGDEREDGGREERG